MGLHRANEKAADLGLTHLMGAITEECSIGQMRSQQTWASNISEGAVSGGGGAP